MKYYRVTYRAHNGERYITTARGTDADDALYRLPMAVSMKLAEVIAVEPMRR